MYRKYYYKNLMKIYIIYELRVFPKIKKSILSKTSFAKTFWFFGNSFIFVFLDYFEKY